MIKPYLEFLNDSIKYKQYSLTLKNIEDNVYKVIAKDDKETVVGTLDFITSKFKPVLKAASVVVSPSYRNQGIASAMYKFAEDELHMKFVRTDEVLTADGKALWNNPNREFGK